MRLIFTLLFFTASISCYSQDAVVSFTDAIKSNIKKYNSKTDIEFEKGNIERGNALFDSLVQNHLVGSRFDDYSFKSVNSRKVKLSKIKKPVFIITYASWCVINKGEIPALNKLARKYDDEVQIIVVFWDVKSDVKKLARQFNNHIKVCYANEAYKNDQNVVATLKHYLGFPTSYLLNKDLEVVDIKRGGIAIPPKTAFKKAFDLNYNTFNDRVVSLIQNQNTVPGKLAAIE
ncbi:TlpA family protein disulfide reductase [Flavobacterium sp. CYK-4]|uniref:TlpA family protein disulfide reductase n=1 Tax=Flavobacterium lotistagni TaxID=2709660 RepID=UPI00140B6178|nr:TlpA disulfide reductase family protein [Flavobacterium lotistagni]NHM07275.1 TlpA family protein disulfide reductase [Flavobacterium lotistagni]